MTIAFVQAAQLNTSGTSVTLAYTSNNTAGNALVAGGRVGNTGATVTVSDSQTNGGWALAKSQVQTTDGHTSYVHACPNCKAGANTVTYAQSGASASIRLAIHEYSGLATSSIVDGTPVAAQGNGSTAANSGSETTGTAADLLFGLVSNANGSASTYTYNNFGTGVAATSRENVSVGKLLTFDGITSATGSYAASVTLPAADNWVAIMVALKGASANVTVNLTGVTATFSAGTLTPGNTEALSGQTVTSSAGTLTPGNTDALTGATITSSAGALLPGNTETLTGQTLTSSAGSVSPGNTEGLNGQSITSSAGSVSPGNTETLGGQTATFSPGTITAQAGGNLTLALTGITATFSAGAITASTGAQPAGKHRKRYGVMDGYRLLLFDTPHQAQAAREIIKARENPAPTRKIRVRAAKALPRPAQVIDIGPLEQLARSYDAYGQFERARIGRDFEELAVLHHQLRMREEEDIAMMLLAAL